MDEPVHFEIVYTHERIESRGGLALIGRLLANTNLKRQLDALSLNSCRKPVIGHGDVVRAFVGLLCLARPDYAAIEDEHHGDLLRLSFGLDALASEETLRQRLDAIAHERPAEARAIIAEASNTLMGLHAPTITPCLRLDHRQWIPLDGDVSPMDNGQTKKQGVGRTYKGCDGYASMFAYLGAEGYQVHAELREGTQHCQKGTPALLNEAIRRSREILAMHHGDDVDPRRERLLVRLDAGHDDIENVRVCRRWPGVDWIIKRNPRKMGDHQLQQWREIAAAHGTCEQPREGKQIWRGDYSLEHGGRMERVVFELTERTSTADGQQLLVPTVELSTWWTSLARTKVSAEKVIALYHDHATSEQFHSEIKSDMALERLPSGKFATNALVLELGMLAYNALRVTGQWALNENDALPAEDRAELKRDGQGRRRTQRRRLRRVIQDLMYLAAKLTRSGRRWRLHVSLSCAWSCVCGAMYERWLGWRPG